MAIAQRACTEAGAIGMGDRNRCAMGGRDGGKEGTSLRRGGEPSRYRGHGEPSRGNEQSERGYGRCGYSWVGISGEILESRNH